MLTLCLDTSAKGASVALYRSNALIADLWTLSANTHSEHLMTMIDTVMKSSEATISDLGAIVVTNGPGSYTGLRIGLSTAKALAQPFGLPIYPVSTLDALAYDQRPYAGGVVVIMDARNGQIYGAAYALEGESLRTVLPKGAYEIGGFVAALPERDAWLLCGDGADIYAKQVEGTTGAKVQLAPESRRTQRAAAAGAYALLHENAITVDHHGLKADYLRQSQAERHLGAGAKV
jgi:tRNA threonylcarbamoyladenosine biosynthesis protein TsaB